ncbi:sensor histidine kinase, partial [Streptomyces scabiei]|uniref:sensor histidine kinase n=1 Tax=Streptomyces scabiei TaxID=1930 RepID=UPI0038F6EF08
MLDLSRIDSGRLTPAISTFPLAPLLLAIGRDHAEDAHAKQLRLRIAPTALSVTTDRVLLDRMIRNLVGNAIRY